MTALINKLIRRRYEEARESAATVIRRDMALRNAKMAGKPVSLAPVGQREGREDLPICRPPGPIG